MCVCVCVCVCVCACVVGWGLWGRRLDTGAVQVAEQEVWISAAGELVWRVTWMCRCVVCGPQGERRPVAVFTRVFDVPLVLKLRTLGVGRGFPWI